MILLKEGINRVKVLYISSTGRSGSTFLATWIGGIPGFVNIGEGRYLFSSKMRKRQLPCGCGSQVENCDFWKVIIPAIDWGTVEFATRLVTTRNFEQLILMSRLKQLQNRRWQDLIASVGKVYSQVASRTRSRVIVDASKHPSYAYLLSQVPEIELYVLHLVRDARGVTASWMKPKGYLGARSPVRVIIEWNVWNLESEFLRLLGNKYLRVQYETFVNTLEDTLRTIMQFVGEGHDFVPSLHVGRNVQHPLAGNPDKLHRGQDNQIQPARWDLPRSLNLTVALLCWPLLMRYGYLRLQEREDTKC